jgi:glutaredoxin 2
MRLYLFEHCSICIRVRMAAVVKGLRLPQKVRAYFEAMMSRIGYQPLPAV